MFDYEKSYKFIFRQLIYRHCKYLKEKIDFRKSNDRQAVDDEDDNEDGAGL